MDRSERSFGELLRSHRLRAGLTQQQLAQRSRLSVRAVRDIEQGRVRRPQARSVELLAATLELSQADQSWLLALAGTESRAGSGRQVRVGVLGPLTVRRGDVAVDVDAAGPRCLLGLLALQPDRVVSRDEIVDVLWEGSPPKTWQSLLHVYVARLRRVLEPQSQRQEGFDILVRGSGGYRLDLDGECLDVVEFDELVARADRAGSDGHPELAGALLAQALECWRGPVLGGSEPRLAQHPATVALADRRVNAALSYATTAAHHGQASRVTALLRPVVADEPLHEDLYARLMLALAASGQQAAALQAFEEIRARLDDELGIEPGAELRAAQVRVLRQHVSVGTVDGAATASDTGGSGNGGAPAPSVRTASTQTAPAEPTQDPGRVRPAQLPAEISVFTGRTVYLDRLDALLAASRATQTGVPRPVLISAIDGSAGVGKTALAVHWSHRVRGHFPDGQLYANLRGYAPTPPARPIEVLSAFLRALGVPADQVPVETEEAAGLYRSLLAERRALVVLDNARDADQVRPLLPASPDCLVLVTSRDRLAGLVAREGAAGLSLDVLTAEEAHDLLVGILGGERVVAEPAAVADLARACAFLPLALRVAAANLTGRPHLGIARYVAELRGGDRLAALGVDGDAQAAVRAAFDLSYTRLDPDIRRMFRLLGLTPGTDVGAEAAAALAEVSVTEARRLLGRLVAAHLVDEHVPGRYVFHDLLRLYAADRAAREDGDAERRAAIGRLHSLYLCGAEAAAGLLYPHLLRLPLPPTLTGPEPVRFTGRAEAMDWLDTERNNLVAAVVSAAQNGPRPVAWHLADALRGYFCQRMYAVDWSTVARVSLDAARADDDPRAQASAHLGLGHHHLIGGRHRQAIDHNRQALTSARQAGWTEGQAAALGNLGILYRLFGQREQAADHITRSLVLHRRTGRLDGQAATLRHLGDLAFDEGRLERATGHYRQAVDLFRRTGSQSGEAIAVGNLGEACHVLGHLGEALDHLTRALGLYREVGDRNNEVDVLRCLAEVRFDTGAVEQALELLDAALTLALDTGNRRMEADSLNALGRLHHRLGRHGPAAGHHRTALRLARDLGYRHGEVGALVGLADAHPGTGPTSVSFALARHALARARQWRYRVFEAQALCAFAALHHHVGDSGAAVEPATRALAIQRGTGHRAGEARTHVLLGDVLRTVGRTGAAVAHWQHALALFAAIGTPEAEETRRLLRAHGSLPVG